MLGLVWNGEERRCQQELSLRRSMEGGAEYGMERRGEEIPGEEYGMERRGDKDHHHGRGDTELSVRPQCIHTGRQSTPQCL